MTVDEYKEAFKQARSNPEAVELILSKLEVEIENDLGNITKLQDQITEQENKIKDMGYQLWLTTTSKPDDTPHKEEEDEDSYDDLIAAIREENKE